MGVKSGASILDRIIGPVLFCDLLRLTRRGSTTIFLARGFYLGLLLLVILIFCGIELGLTSPTHFLDAFRAGFPVAANKAANFFFVLLGAQLAIVLLLTPAYVAGAIAEDRERRIIDHLLVSELSNREIVLGKYLSRLGHLGLLLLTGVPLLAVAQVVGGVHPVFLLTGLVVAVMTMASLGALSILESICNSRPHRAVLRIYMVLGFYLLISTGFTIARVPSSWSALSMPDRAGVIGMSANPLLPVVRLVENMGNTDWPQGFLVEVLTDCAIIHGLFTIGCLGLAIYRLRSYLASTPLSHEERLAVRLQRCYGGLDEETARHLAALAHPHRSPVPFRPPLKDQPILWKALHVESLPIRFSHELRALFVVVLRILSIILGSLLPVLLLLIFISSSSDEHVGAAFFALSVILMSLLLVGVAAHAAGSLSGERERNTLDALLASALENSDIINGKWWASLLKMRRCAILLALVWATSSLLGILAWKALLVLILATISWACCASSLGVGCSLLCRTTGRSTAMTLGLLLAMSLFPWLLGWKEFSPGGIVHMLTEPASWETRMYSGVFSSVFVRGLSGVFVSSFLAALLWTGTHFFFPRITGRMPAGSKNRQPESVLADNR